MTMAGHLYHLRTRNNFIYYFMRGTAIIKIIIKDYHQMQRGNVQELLLIINSELIIMNSKNIQYTLFFSS